MKLENTLHDSQVEPDDLDKSFSCFPTSFFAAVRNLERALPEEAQRPHLASDDSERVFIAKLNANKSHYQKLAVKGAGHWASTYDPRYVWGFYPVLAKEYCRGYRVEFMSLKLYQLIKVFDELRHPMPIGTDLTHSGHIVNMIGYEENGLWCNDPWGDKNAAVYRGSNGHEVFYTFDQLGFKEKIHTLAISYDKEFWEPKLLEMVLDRW